MFNRQKKFRMETLEPRQMMAGDIAVDNSNGILAITEAQGQQGQANTVVVSTLANGRVHVLGGGINQDYLVTGKVTIDLGGGSDTVVFQGDLDDPGDPYTTEVHINVAATNTSDPNDHDQVEVFGTYVHGSLRIDTGVGVDRVWVHDTAVYGDGLAIFTGAGADEIEVRDCFLDGLLIQTYSSLSETDADQVAILGNYDYHDFGNVHVWLGGGNDVFRLDGVWADKVEINAGAGNDTGTLSDVYVDELMTRMGVDSDTLDVHNVDANVLSLLGEGGINDRLTKRGDVTFRSLAETGWERINGRLVLSPRIWDVLTTNVVRRPFGF